MKYVRFLTLFALLLTYAFLPLSPASAETPSSVLDCLDSEEDCFDTEEEVDEELNSDEEEGLTLNEYNSGSTFLNIVKMFFALLLVLALLYVVVKLLSSRQKLNKKVTSLENLGGISVGNNKSIQIIRVGQTFYLIGVGDNVELLQKIEDEELIETLLVAEHVEDDSLASYILALFSKKKQNNVQRESDFKQQFADELNKITDQRQTMINKHTEKEDGHE